MESEIYDDDMKAYISSATRGPTDVQLIEKADLVDNPLLPLVNSIRTSQSWLGQAQWLQSSAQGAQRLYFISSVMRWKWAMRAAKV